MTNNEFLDAAKQVLDDTGRIGSVSDGYHTYDELYHHRAMLFASLCHAYPSLFWKSKKHDDGTMYAGMFIVGMNTRSGQATYHYDVDPYWHFFDCKELDKAPVFDGHTPDDAIRRIYAECHMRYLDNSIRAAYDMADAGKCDNDTRSLRQTQVKGSDVLEATAIDSDALGELLEYTKKKARENFS